MRELTIPRRAPYWKIVDHKGEVIMTTTRKDMFLGMVRTAAFLRARDILCDVAKVPQ